jgi:peptidoglycan hydrolase CwlO-like protein
MQNISSVSLLIFVALICSCQKQDSTGDQQFAQRKAELDAREHALDERMNALNERINILEQRLNALPERGETTTNAQAMPPPIPAQIPEPPQPEPQIEMSMQNSGASGSDPDYDRAEKERLTREELANRQQDVERGRQRKLQILQNSKMQAAPTSPASGAASPTPK